MKIDAKILTASLLDWLDSKYSDKVITTEISINTSIGTKVADVVLSNGHTIAYEIKSELDTVKRLGGQLKGFCEIFDYVYVVYWGDRFSLEDLRLPPKVGAIKAYKNKNGNICFCKVVNAHINRQNTPKDVAHFLWKKELHYFLGLKNIKFKMDYDKDKLIELFIKSYTKTQSVKVFRLVLKKRFEKGFLAYKESRSIKAITSNKTDFNYLNTI